MKKAVAGIFLLSLLGACASTPTSTATNAAMGTSHAPSKPGNASSGTTAAAQPSALPAHRNPNNLLAQKRDVYFDFDQYVVKDEFRPVIQAHAKYLDDNRTFKIKLEGNADERGSREYNLALGQKRADSVKTQMMASGVAQNQIEAISWGSEKPKASGHDEAAWGENRRVDIRYSDDK